MAAMLSFQHAILNPAGWRRDESVFADFFGFFTRFRSLRPGP
jgi:hypothetical protein